MRFRVSIGFVIAMSMIPTLSMTMSAPAGAASWTAWHASCAKWILDIPKVDSAIETDTSNTNYVYLEIDFAGLAADGRHIETCSPSPDAALTSLDHRYGEALHSTGLACANWASSRGRASISGCYAWIEREKSMETQVENRLQAIEG